MSATACARVVIDQLIGQGVTDLVLCPGSRSAPLAYAAAAAERTGRLRLHVRLDERGAAFLALGLATASGRCVPVVTTSGTAAANLHPAALEAWHAGVPLLLLTADRPLAMQETGANQTTSQRGLFARTRAEAQLDSRDADPRVWRHQVTRLVTAALGRRSAAPGPVHLNLALDEPLMPGEAEPQPKVPSPGVQRVASRAATSPPVVLPAGRRTVLVAGDARPEVGAAAVRLAATARVPLLAEPSSNARGGAESISGYRLLLGSALAAGIERVIMVGRPTLSRPVQRLLGRADVELVVISEDADWVDPGTNASQVAGAVDLDAGDPGWLGRWQEADRALRPRIEELIRSAPAGGLTGPAVAELLWRSLTRADVLVAGSSNPVRDLDLVGPKREPDDVPTVYANRGLAGIDGTVSTAVGVGLGAGRPTHALLGDLTFLHDLTGLLVGPSEPRPDLRLLVANDDGGSIFATLEQGAPQRSADFERLFGTPQHADLAALCAGAGVPHHRVGTGAGLETALTRPPRGIEVLEVSVDRTGRRDLDAALRAAGTEVGDRA